MKKGEAAELSSKWWKASQPKGLTSATKLELALKAHEVAVAGLKADPKDGQLKTALDTIDQVKDAVSKTIAEAAKAKGNAEMEFTVQALKKIDFAKESKQLEGEVKKGKPGDNDDEDSPSIADPTAFAGSLRKSLNKLKDEPWNWGFLCGKKPIEHRLLLSRSKNGRTLAQAAAKELGRPAKVSFGTAIRSPDDDRTIILTVQGAMLAGLATRAKKMLAKMKPQPISEVLLMVDGKIVAETVDPDDVDDDGPGDAQVENPALEALHRRIEALEPRAAAVMQAQPAMRDRLTAAIQQMMAAMAKEDAATAGPLLDRLEQIIARLEGASGPTGQAKAPADLRAARDAIRGSAEKLVAALTKADAQVRKLQAFLAVHPDPQLREIAGSPDMGLNALTDGHRVRVLAALQDLRAAPDDKLPAVLTRARKVIADFDSHLKSSGRVEACDQNSFGIPVAVRPALQPVLAELTRTIATVAA